MSKQRPSAIRVAEEMHAKVLAHRLVREAKSAERLQSAYAVLVVASQCCSPLSATYNGALTDWRDAQHTYRADRVLREQYEGIYDRQRGDDYDVSPAFLGMGREA